MPYDDKKKKGRKRRSLKKAVAAKAEADSGKSLSELKPGHKKRRQAVMENVYDSKEDRRKRKRRRLKF